MDINECQVGSHDCKAAERCDNTLGSYHCARIHGCGTGYTLNYANGLCEDDDECVLGTHNCNELGTNFICRNIVGSYRCQPVRPKSRPVPPSPPTFPTAPPSYSTPTSTQLTTPTIPQTISTSTGTYPIAPVSTRLIQTPPQPYPTPRPISRIYQIPPRTNTMQFYIPYHTTSKTLVSDPAGPLVGQLKKCLPGYVMNTRGGCEGK
ncbi:hypothetical protein NQ314_018913 [Rhamnusium bicolor]|uniref:EGF-like calcium-binding domain-containing protein n=1 Tax=Rhamnusium bicolor TaxID=1586634 RepID=A0AAV8WQI2_9CUCU|nr:hypothetical protein NQ314_018913 [Rhamnusium bicolor]